MTVKDWRVGADIGNGHKIGEEGPCMGHTAPCSNTGYWRMQNTAYIDWEANFRCLCNECQEQADADWQEMWDEYWAGRL